MFNANREITPPSDAGATNCSVGPLADFAINGRQTQQEWYEAQACGNTSLSTESNSLNELVCIFHSAQQEGEQPSLARIIQPTQFGHLGFFTSLWCGDPLLGGMGCQSIHLRRLGAGAEATVNMLLRRAATAEPYNVPCSDFQIGPELRFRLGLQPVPGQQDRPVVVFTSITGLSHPDEDGVRRNVSAMEIHRTDRGLRYVLTLQGVTEPLEVTFGNTTAYTGFLDMHRRIGRMTN